MGAGHGYPHLGFGILCLIVLLLAAGGVALVRRSRLGAAMLAVRANERSAAASGVSVSQVKLIAFAIGGFLAGLGGAMLAYQQTSADYSSYTAVGSVTFFATVYIAGITSVSGGINAGVIAAGGIIYTLVNNGVPLWIYVLLVGLLLVGIVQLVRPALARAALAVVGLGAVAAAVVHHGGIQLGAYYAAISGVLLILTVILNPEGIVGPVHTQLAALRARLRGAPLPGAGRRSRRGGRGAAQADRPARPRPARSRPAARGRPPVGDRRQPAADGLRAWACATAAWSPTRT